jgi:hypothetical protein
MRTAQIPVLPNRRKQRDDVAGSDRTFYSHITWPASSTTHTAVSNTDTSSPQNSPSSLLTALGIAFRINDPVKNVPRTKPGLSQSFICPRCRKLRAFWGWKPTTLIAPWNLNRLTGIASAVHAITGAAVKLPCLLRAVEKTNPSCFHSFVATAIGRLHVRVLGGAPAGDSRRDLMLRCSHD